MHAASDNPSPTSWPTERILGLDFFAGSAEAALQAARETGGVVVAPAAPTLVLLPEDGVYRDAMERADIVLTDSGLLMLLHRLSGHRAIPRTSGLRFVESLLDDASFAGESALWVMPREEEAQFARDYLGGRGLTGGQVGFYIAPFYEGPAVEDAELLARLEKERPQWVILGIAGGKQEKLGVWLRDNLSYRPGIVCIGAAIGFLTGGQVRIPRWVDRLYLGWLWRCMWRPGVYLPRYARSVRLIGLYLRYGREMPPSG